MNIRDIFNLARIECSAESNDISDETLLMILNENLREFLFELQTRKSDEYFAVTITNDLVPGQEEYWKLEYTDAQWRVIWITKILKVRLHWKNIPRVDVLQMDNNQNIQKPCYWISGQDLYVYHNSKNIEYDAIEVIWLSDIPKIDLNTPTSEFFLWKIQVPEKILKMWLKPFLYERVWNLNASVNARQEYLSEMKRCINSIWRVKEPMIRELPNLSEFS